jgi:hypothetical protein
MRYLFLCVAIVVVKGASSQPGQINIDRIEAMPKTPVPYMMRDWKDVARKYDELIYRGATSGTHFPLLTLKSSGRNFPMLVTIQMDTYVGTTSETQAEAINIIPSIVGASLAGIDKFNMNGTNWVEKIKDFYNSANGQNVYLNGTNSSSGNDWWYDVMPNVFFYQAYDLYPNIAGFEEQFISVAERWLEAVYAMGGKTTPWTVPMMNYRGWYLASMTGNSSGVKEPEASGAIGWLLYHAYLKTGEKKFLYGAQMCIDFLAAQQTNPSYELQLPYGTQTAAKLNATLGSNYDIKKMLDWSFNRGALRGWGTIVGTWDGKNVSGLVGEANDAGNDYAFAMNGFQQAAALVPVAKYDKRFARAIAKWTLNLANASRFFYPQFLGGDHQDDFAWSNQYDPQSVIAYEALKENLNGKPLYGTGDAKRNGWAATNLALYGSSHVGYLGAIVETTDVDMILKLDLNKTDFFNDETFPSYLFYNPYATSKTVTLHLGSNAVDLYDAISETTIAEGVSGDYALQISSDKVRLVTYLPAGTTTELNGNKLYAGEHIIDYHYGNDFAPSFRIKSLAADKSIVEYNSTAHFYVTVENEPSTVSYKWYVNDIVQSVPSTNHFTWTSLATAGENKIKVEATSAGVTLKDSLMLSVVETIPTAPEIIEITTNKNWYLEGEPVKVITKVQGASTEHFEYQWTVPAGSFVQNDSLIEWTATEEGLYIIECTVTNEFDLSAKKSISVLIKSQSAGTTAPLAYYPLNLDVRDYSGHDYHANIEGTQQADDALGLSDFAYRFSSGNDIVYVDNKPELNFRDAITLSFWISPVSVGHEAFILSHGSWEERWKVSVTPEKKLRWTVKTESRTVDLDSSEPLVDNVFIHVTAVYSGYSMELYIDGELDTYTTHNGLIMTTQHAITFGEKSIASRAYYYSGVLDEVRIYNNALQPDEIALLKTLWTEEIPTEVSPEMKKAIDVFPNPSITGAFTIHTQGQTCKNIQLTGIDGRALEFDYENNNGVLAVTTKHFERGVCLLKVTTASDVIVVKVVFL